MSYTVHTYHVEVDSCLWKIRLVPVGKLGVLVVSIDPNTNCFRSSVVEQHNVSKQTPRERRCENCYMQRFKSVIY